jgi:hypothetical protein
MGCRRTRERSRKLYDVFAQVKLNCNRVSTGRSQVKVNTGISSREKVNKLAGKVTFCTLGADDVWPR